MDYDNDAELYINLTLQFKAIKVVENQLIPSTFTLKTQLMWNEDEEEDDRHDFETQLAISKIRFWFENIIDESVMFSRANTWAIRAFLSDEGTQTVENHLVVLPDDPADSLLAEIFQSKMNALAGNALHFGYVDLSADNANGFSFLFAGYGEYNLPNMEQWIGTRSYFSKPWWARDDASTIDVIPDEHDDLKDTPNFAYSLNFLGDSISSENKPTARIIRPEFKPEIIKGGKNGK